MGRNLNIFKTSCMVGLIGIITLPALAKMPSPTMNTRPKNIVIMIGDGMGPAYTSAYRYYKDNPDTEEVEKTVFDRLLVGMASTYPADESGYITDSAASATALATGHKSYNGAISVDVNKRPVTTLFEQAKQLGKKTGIAVTSQINHATPAAFITHNESRRNYDQIAQSYLESGTDVMLGGGQRYFPAKLLKQFEQKGYQVFNNTQQLTDVTQGKALGLFADVQLPWAIDNPNANQLSILTRHALSLLNDSDEGFVLLVEGSLIDWAGHSNDIATAMAEVNEFANAIEVVEQFSRQHPDTLVLITADHSTGGLTVAANGDYAWRPDMLAGVTHNPEQAAERALSYSAWQPELAKVLGVSFTKKELEVLSSAHTQGQEKLAEAIRQLIDQRTNTGWTGGGHTGIDVQVFAKGPGAQLFIGHQDNTEIFTKILSLMTLQ